VCRVCWLFVASAIVYAVNFRYVSSYENSTLSTVRPVAAPDRGGDPHLSIFVLVFLLAK